MDSNNLKWHQKPAGVIALLILFFPVGLFLMWKNKLWTPTTRVVVTIVIGVLLAGGGGGENSTNSVGTSSAKPDVCDCMQYYIHGWKDARGRVQRDLRSNCYEHYSEPFTDHDKDCPPAQLW